MYIPRAGANNTIGVMNNLTSDNEEYSQHFISNERCRHIE